MAHSRAASRWQLLALLACLVHPLLAQEAATSSSIIPSAGSVSLLNGNGDVAAKGLPYSKQPLRLVPLSPSFDEHA